MKGMSLYGVVKKLTGPIDPVGETNADDKRYENLQSTIDLVDKLLVDIKDVATNANRQEYSMKRAGIMAEKFIHDLKEVEV